MDILLCTSTCNHQPTELSFPVLVLASLSIGLSVPVLVLASPSFGLSVPVLVLDYVVYDIISYLPPGCINHYITQMMDYRTFF